MVKYKTNIVELAKAAQQQGGRVFEVGGTVRDRLLNRSRKNEDIDLEVYGLSADKLEQILNSLGKVNLTGKSFAVYRLGDAEISLPREDRSIGLGHKDFKVKVNPNLSFVEACRRRDFTVNAILQDVLTGEIVDPLNAQNDLNHKILRACDQKHFFEDPLRVYRAVRFRATLGFSLEMDTLDQCRKMSLENLPEERIFAEIRKMLVEADYPGWGLHTAHACGVLYKDPEITDLLTCPQEMEWHPEGNVFIHTVLSLKAAAYYREFLEDDQDKLVLMLAVLFHDIGKPLTTKIGMEGRKKDRIISPGHQGAGVKLTEVILNRWKAPHKIIHRVKNLVGYHHRIYDLWKAREVVTPGAIRRLLRDCELQLLKYTFLSDKFGRGQPPSFSPEVDWLERTIVELEIDKQKLEPLLMGRHLLELGLKPSPRMGEILDRAYESQMDGEFDSLEEGLKLVKKWIEQEI